MRLEKTALLRAVLVGSLAVLALLPQAPADPAPAMPPEDVLANYPWPDALKEALASPPFAGHATLIDAPADATGKVVGKVLRVSVDKATTLRLPLLTVPNPPVTADFYALAGQVKYEGVDGTGYVEMWNTFPALPGGAERSFFSRTLGVGTEDPMDGFRGTSGWRPVILPFNSAGAGARPTKLTVNLVLPAGGTVYLSPLHLAQYHYGSGPTGASSPADPSGRPGWQLPAATAAAVFLAAAVVWGVWRAVSRRRAAEWRRMAAHDASVR